MFSTKPSSKYLLFGITFAVLCLSSCKTDSPFNSQHSNKAQAPNTASNIETVDCASCHAYPIPSGHHKLHLIDEEAGSPNGSLTCSDCHFESIQTHTQELGSSFLHIPQIQASTFAGGMTSEEVVDYNSLLKFVEAYKDENPRTTLPLKTSNKHMNNEINLAFAPNTLLPSDSAHWNPQRMSCSMIECHANPEKEQLWN